MYYIYIIYIYIYTSHICIHTYIYIYIYIYIVIYIFEYPHFISYVYNIHIIISCIHFLYTYSIYIFYMHMLHLTRLKHLLPSALLAVAGETRALSRGNARGHLKVSAMIMGYPGYICLKPCVNHLYLYSYIYILYVCM